MVVWRIGHACIAFWLIARCSCALLLCNIICSPAFDGCDWLVIDFVIDLFVCTLLCPSHAFDTNVRFSFLCDKPRMHSDFLRWFVVAVIVSPCRSSSLKMSDINKCSDFKQFLPRIKLLSLGEGPLHCRLKPPWRQRMRAGDCSLPCVSRFEISHRGVCPWSPSLASDFFLDFPKYFARQSM